MTAEVKGISMTVVDNDLSLTTAPEWMNDLKSIVIDLSGMTVDLSVNCN